MTYESPTNICPECGDEYIDKREISVDLDKRTDGEDTYVQYIHERKYLKDGSPYVSECCRRRIDDKLPDGDIELSNP